MVGYCTLGDRMKASLALALVILFNPSFSLAAQSGTALICSSADNEIKLTADLSENEKKDHKKTSEQVVVTVVEGIRNIYRDSGKDIQLIRKPTTQLTVSDLKRKNQTVTLFTDDSEEKPQVAHSGEGMTITKFQAGLSIPHLKIDKEHVTCLETQWNDSPQPASQVTTPSVGHASDQAD